MFSSAFALPLAIAGIAQQPPPPAHATIGIVAADTPATHTTTLVQRLGGPAATESLSVAIGDERITLDLRPHSLRTENFQLLVQGADGVLRPQPAAPPRTFRGSVREWSCSEVVGSYANGRLTALVRSADNGEWCIQPVARAQADETAPIEHVVFARMDVEPAEGTCGVTPEQEAEAQLRRPLPDQAGEGGGGPRGGAYDTEISFDADFEFFQLNGSSVNATVDDIEAVMIGVDSIYRAEVGIQYVVNRMIVRTGPGAPYTSSNQDTLLGQLVEEWEDNHGGQERDTAHLMTGKDIDGSTIGYAFVGVICDVSSAYGFSQSRFTTNMVSRVAVTAHELGHNYGASHCNGASDCSIMCSSIGGCAGNLTQFGVGETNQIVAYRNAVGCLGGFNNTVYVNQANNTGSEDGSPAQPYNTIREGLWAANPGGTLIISPGNYDFERTSSVINRPVTLRGTTSGIAYLGQ